MASKYKMKGPLGNAYITRDFKRWVVTSSDGEELTLQRKRYATMMFEALIARGVDAHIYEETVMRSIFADDTAKEDTFRIDITERMKLEIKYSMKDE